MHYKPSVILSKDRNSGEVKGESPGATLSPDTFAPKKKFECYSLDSSKWTVNVTFLFDLLKFISTLKGRMTRLYLSDGPDR